jgi:hypothetical protein
LLLLAGCATLRTYPGDPLDPTHVARILPVHTSYLQILIEEVDGRRLNLLQDRAEVLPGRHELVVTALVDSQGRRTSGTHRLEFTAEEGCEYRVCGDWYLYGARIWIEESDSGRRVAVAETRPPRGILPPVGLGR